MTTSIFKTMIIPTAILWLMATPGTLPALDTVVTHSEGSIRGDIKAMTPTGIEMEESGVKISIPINDIDSIRFDEEPHELSDVRSRIRGGQLDDALNMLKSIDVGSIDRTVVKQELQFHYAYALAQLAMGGSRTVEEAMKAMGAFIGENPGNFHYFEATELYGDLAVVAGDYPRAEKAYTAAARAPGPLTAMRLAVARARLYQAQGKHAQAIAEFEKVLGAGLQGPAADHYRLKATLGKAASLARTKQGPAGLKLVHGVIKSAERGDTEIHSQAYLALGDCHLAMGDPKAAVLAYLHVDALYYQHPAQHAEALARIANLWEQMDRPQRSATARKTLKSQYPNSQWAKQ